MDEIIEEAREEEVTEAAPEQEQEEQFTEETPAKDDEEEERLRTEKKPWFKKRLDGLTVQREAARQEALAAKAEAERLRKELEAIAIKSADKPKYDDFETDSDYYEALTDWKINQAQFKQRQETEKERYEREKKTQEYEFAQTVAAVNAKGQKKYRDYEDVVFSLPADIMNEELAGLIIETDNPEDVAYHLGRNPEEAERISKLSLKKKAIALGKIETRLQSAKKTTSAPPPINPVKGATPGTFDAEKLLKENPAKWIELRNAGKI